MKWQIGDIAISLYRSHYGDEVEIQSFDHPLLTCKDDCSVINISRGRSDHESGLWGYQFSKMKPLPDGNQASIWKDCVFKPKELVT